MITFSHQGRVRVDPRRLYRVDQQITAFHGNKPVGRINLFYNDLEVAQQDFSKWWHFYQLERGWGLSDELEKMWIQTHMYALSAPASVNVSPLSLSSKHFPGEELALQDLMLLGEKLKAAEEINNWKNYWRGFVFVGWSGVDDDYQRQGIGTQLYRYAAWWCAYELNLPLHSSTLISEQAVSLWESLDEATRPSAHVKSRWVLDHR